MNTEERDPSVESSVHSGLLEFCSEAGLRLMQLVQGYCKNL